MKTSKIIIIGLFVGLLSSGLPNFVTPDAYAVTGFTAETTSTTEITITFDVANMDAASIVDSDFEITLDDGTVITDADFNIAFSDGTGAGGNDQSVITLTANIMPTDDSPDVELLAGESVTSGGGLTVLNGAVNAEATDGVSPTVVSAETVSSRTIELTMSESVTNDSAVAGDFTLDGIINPPVVTGISGSGSSALSLSLSKSIVYGDSLTLTYTLNGRVIDDGATGNQLAAFSSQSITNNVSEIKVSTSGCYDCIPPTLQASHIAISNNEYTMITDDNPLHITANIGDKVTILLNVTDNKPVSDFKFAGLYTNFNERPSDMNLFYANNYDNLKQVSTSFYEWNIRAANVAYDYDETFSWSASGPEIITDDTNTNNFEFQNDHGYVQYFMMPFTFTINDHMDSTSIIVKVYDGGYNRLHVTLPVTLQTAGNDPLNFENIGKQKVLGFYDESILYEKISQWSESESDPTQLSSLLGISDEILPLWTSNLAIWVTEGTIDSADLIVAVEYLINQ